MEFSRRSSVLLLAMCSVSLQAWSEETLNKRNPWIDQSCPFQSTSSDTKDLFDRSLASIAQLQAEKSKCPGFNFDLKSLQDGVTTLRDLQNSEEANLDREYQFALKQALRSFPVDNFEYANCVTASPSDRDRIQQCMTQIYAEKIRRLRDDQDKKRTAEEEAQLRKKISSAVQDLNAQTNNLVQAYAESCKTGGAVLSTVVATVLNLSSLASVGMPGAGLFGLGMAGSVSALGNLISKIFSDKTLPQLSEALNSESNFPSYACLYMAVEDKTLGCNQVLSEGPSSALPKPPLPSNHLLSQPSDVMPQEILRLSMPDPVDRSNSMGVPIWQYLATAQKDLSALAKKSAGKRQALILEQVQKLQRVQDSFDAINKGDLPFDSDGNKTKYKLFEDAIDEMNKSFKETAAPQENRWAFYPASLSKVVDLHGVLAVHKNAMSSLEMKSEVANLEWLAEAQKRANDLQLQMIKSTRSDADLVPLGQMHTAMVMALRTRFENRLKAQYETAVTNSKRSGDFGYMIPLIQMCSLTAGIYHFEDGKKNVGIKGKAFSHLSVSSSTDYQKYCAPLECSKGLPALDPPVKPGTEDPGEIKRLHKHLCQMSLGYNSYLSSLNDEFSSKKTVCGRTLGDSVSEKKQRH